MFSKVYPKLLSMTERVKRVLGLAPKQTGNTLLSQSAGEKEFVFYMRKK